MTAALIHALTLGAEPPPDHFLPRTGELLSERARLLDESPGFIAPTVRLGIGGLLHVTGAGMLTIALLSLWGGVGLGAVVGPVAIPMMLLGGGLLLPGVIVSIAGFVTLGRALSGAATRDARLEAIDRELESLERAPPAPVTGPALFRF